mmetsp:Transcript_15290/g.22880  ORF Transcript_15290/g.22880 Transcript_15290/m.22880 type:complete len:155 (+) Transcript_15290:57-521(+)
MSSQGRAKRGDPRKGQPSYLNSTAFRHNKGSKKTQKILSLPNEGLCRRCHEKIEWKKKYRKYKPLTVKRRCTECKQKAIIHAYHTVCKQCAIKKDICAWCKKANEIVNPMATKKQLKERENAQQEMLESMSERERRTYYRQQEQQQSDSSDSDQ